MILRIKKSEIVFVVVFTYPMWNMFLDWLVTDNIRYNIWRILVALFFIYVNCYLMQKSKNRLIMMDILICFSVVYLLVKGRSVSYFFNNDVFLFWFLLMILFFWDKDNLLKFKNYIIMHNNFSEINAIVTIVLCILSVIMGEGFISSQRTIVFRAFFQIEHGLAYHVLVTYMLLLFAEKYNSEKKHLILKICLCLILILTAVRSAFIVLLLLVLVDFVHLKLYQKISVSIIMIAALIIVFSNASLLSLIPILNKTVAAQNAGDATNGRSILSSIGYMYFLQNTTFLEKLFGITMYRLRNEVYWSGLHAHNDAVNIGLGYGIVYLGVVLTGIIKFCKGRKGYVVFFAIMVLAYFNGLYMYMEIVVAFPIIKFALGSEQFLLKIKKTNRVFDCKNDIVS